MLPVSIIANWCLTSATTEMFGSVVDKYVKGATKQNYDRDTHAIHWRERTVFTFEDNEWSRNEGSLLFDNRRGIVLRTIDDENSHLIFLSLFPSSLAHLKKSIIEIMEAEFGSSVLPLEFNLGKGSANFARTDLAGAELTNFENETLIVVNGQVPANDDLFDHLLYDDIEFFKQHPNKFYLSKLYLKLGELRTETILSRDGVLTLNDPNLSLDEVIGIVSEVIGNVPSSTSGSQERYVGQSGSAASASQSAAPVINNFSTNSALGEWGMSRENGLNELTCEEE